MDKRKTELYFFTDSFPYSVNYEWKRLELNHLSNKVNSLTVIPFTYKAKEIQSGLIQNIKILEPSLGHFSFVKWYRFYFLFSSHFMYFMREFFSHRVYTKKSHFNQWFLASLYTYKLLRKKVIKEIIDLPEKEAENTILYFYWAMSNALIIPRLKKKYKKIVVRLHGFDLYDERQNGYIPYQYEMLKNADVICNISAHGKKYLSGKYPDLTEKIKLHYLGVPLFGLNPIRHKGEKFHIVSCSRVISLKRVEFIAYALNQIPEGIEWTHFGDGEYFNELKNIIEGLQLRQHRINLPGWKSQDEIRKFYSAVPVDVFINLSWSEGLPVSVMEAASFGIPILATNVGGTYEIVSRENGYLLRPDFELEELTLAIAEFIKMPDQQIQNMRKASRFLVEEKFDFINNVREFENDLLD